MKVRTEYPTPVPITWTLTLTDDEMMDLVTTLHTALGPPFADRSWRRLENEVPPASIARLSKAL